MNRRYFLSLPLLAAPLYGQNTVTPLDEAALARLLASHKGKVVLVDFWATWCSPCLEELPLLVKLEAKLRAKRFVLLPISCDEREEAPRVVETLRKSGAGSPYYLKQAKSDEAFIDFIDRKWRGALPALFLYDRQGKLSRSFIGETPVPEIESAVAGLL